ncbi:restriction endonuclease subunit S [Eubacterium sp. AM28-29]|uniref:restriction endonuclease subunit S n=1 Tax=Holdemanella porci TaxID=2652276 RepID=UPI000E474448|nr:restriction endonuclease subunit S [Eubacterium sp. AM28-29]
MEQCIDDEIPFTIPQKWSWIRLKNISIINMGASPEGESLSSNNENGFEFHQGKIFFGDKYLNRSNVYTCEPIKFAEENSLLLCVRAPVGKLNITRRNVCIGRGLCAIKPYGNIRTDFLYYFLLTYEKYFTQNSTGSTFKAITSNVIFDCLFPLPSLDEQNKIIKTLEKVYSILK